MTERPLTLTDLRLIVEAASAAPSLHNSQPWRFRPTADLDGLLVYADPGRAVPATDPDGRALHLSVGAAVFNLRAAAAHLGRGAAVRLCPDPADQGLLAAVDLTGDPAGPGPRLVPELYEAIARRHSSRQPFTNRDVPETVVGELMAAAEAEDVHLAVLEEAGARRVLELTAEAELRTSADLQRQAETRGWLRAEPSTDGIPLAALGPLDHDARVPMRGFAGRPQQSAPPTERFEALPQLAVLSTHGDRAVDWLRAGQALERMWLVATARGIRASVLHQAVEWPDTRWRLRDPAEGPGHVQAVVRIGYGPPGTPTPRRAVDEVLDLGGLPLAAR
ncbi:Acg family FMN-binding oxidoreductase [Kitasatospora sp. NPDC048365]|uniref:Acg family FMN-binding oxidoreductase n=1 Tax=Kitasatospora sp. NPDC048365 TaxID=3364050 RepID=UPI00371A5B75